MVQMELKNGLKQLRVKLDIQFFGGRGASSGGGGGGGSAGGGMAGGGAIGGDLSQYTPQQITAAGGVIQDYPEAFSPGKDYQAVNGVDHNARTVSRTTQREWDQYATPMSNGVTARDDNNIMRQFCNTANADGDYVSGYVRTRNSFTMNKQLYDPNNAGKTPDQIFTRSEDRATIRSLDKAINNNVTQADGSYTRFCTAESLQKAFGFSDNDMKMITNADKLSPTSLANLNKALSGSKSSSPAYTSTSANRTLNAFSNKKTYTIERRVNVPKGTKAYAPLGNAQESEVLFGRNMNTDFGGISVASDGHIVIHEVYNSYR